MTFLYEAVHHVITAWSSVVGAGRQRCWYKNYNRTQIERHVVLSLVCKRAKPVRRSSPIVVCINYNRKKFYGPGGFLGNGKPPLATSLQLLSDRVIYCVWRHNPKLCTNAWMEQLSFFMCSEFESLQKMHRGVRVSPAKLTTSSIINAKTRCFWRFSVCRLGLRIWCLTFDVWGQTGNSYLLCRLV